STFSPQSYSTHRDLHSFPTRRSSDLRHDPRERRRISGARAVGRAQVREDPQRQGVSAGPEKVIRDEIRALTAYHVQSAEGMVKLDAMENPYRLPDGLRREIGEAVANAEINRYPDPTAPALVKRLRKVMGIAPEYDVLLGNGSDEIIHIIVQ